MQGKFRFPERLRDVLAELVMPWVGVGH